MLSAGALRKSAGMTQLSGGPAARFLAVFAIALQMLLPGSVALAQARGVDTSSYICAPSGVTSPEVRAFAAQFAALTGEAPHKAPLSDGHCPFCTASHGAPIPQPAQIGAPLRFARIIHHPSRAAAPVRRAQGPPVGSRGPPH